MALGDVGKKVKDGVLGTLKGTGDVVGGVVDVAKGATSRALTGAISGVRPIGRCSSGAPGRQRIPRTRPLPRVSSVMPTIVLPPPKS